jgi:hypothetical protein
MPSTLRSNRHRGRVRFPITDLEDTANVRLALAACAATLARKPAAGSTQRRKRSVFYNALIYAVELGHLGSNPVDRIQWTAPAVAQTEPGVHGRIRNGPTTASAMTPAVSSSATPTPSASCPSRLGWYRACVNTSTNSVPLPTAACPQRAGWDHRLDHLLQGWEEARRLAFTPAQVATPLAGRPYDLRHAALTTWLNAGIPPGEVSKRAGNSVEVLLRRYAGCLDKQADAINRRIEQSMSAELSADFEMEP